MVSLGKRFPNCTRVLLRKGGNDQFIHTLDTEHSGQMLSHVISFVFLSIMSASTVVFLLLRRLHRHLEHIINTVLPITLLNLLALNFLLDLILVLKSSL